LFVFLEVSHMPCYSAWQTAAIRQNQLPAAQCRAPDRCRGALVIATCCGREVEIEVAAHGHILAEQAGGHYVAARSNSKDQQIASET
jgi:hypothetical protein